MAAARTTSAKPKASGKKGASPKASAKALLSRYREKRDFSKTPEPTGGTSTGKTRAFCVQKHLASHLHYDFRLEHRGVLLSWAVPKGPSLNPRDKRLAMRVEDHPFDYRTFEGVIPSGYGAGVVMLWDEGTWEPEAGFEDVDAALRKGELKFTIDAAKLKGSWVLVRTRGGPTPTGEREQWLLIKHRDEWAGEVDVTAKFDKSVRTERDFEGILKSEPDVWESHKAAGGGNDMQKIIEKVLNYTDSHAGGAAEKAAPKKAAGKSGGAKKAAGNKAPAKAKSGAKTRKK
jgi:bifunctional non-homologous end joining protein LigD